MPGRSVRSAAACIMFSAVAIVGWGATYPLFNELSIRPLGRIVKRLS
jgi:hypothetical protein